MSQILKKINNIKRQTEESRIKILNDFFNTITIIYNIPKINF